MVVDRLLTLKKIKFGEFTDLLNNENPTAPGIGECDRLNGWLAIDGILTNAPAKQEGTARVADGNLRVEQECEDFNVKLEVNFPTRGNCGVYLKCRLIELA